MQPRPASATRVEATHMVLTGDTNAHGTLFVLATGVVVLGIGLAWVLHAANRGLGDRLRASMLATPGLKWLALGSEHGCLSTKNMITWEFLLSA